MKQSTRAVAKKENMVLGECYRISVLTNRLIRIEYEPEGHFEDRATQTVQNRDFPVVSYQVKEKSENSVIVETEKLKLVYDGKKFSPQGLSITLKENGKTWNYGSHGWNLGGTCRTLDGADGQVLLETGLFSEEGYSYFDDSKSVVLEDELMQARENAEEDIYFFGYGTDYKAGLRDFYFLCGKVPMIPRYALGNWWSRFHKYSEESYMELVENFKKEEIPLSVAVIDMDWHITEVDPKYGSGWTGYTFNKELFPDPERFLTWLHEQNLAVTLNVHPADGIRAFEEMYPKMAEAMGIDPATEEPIEFDMTDSKYRENFFTYVNHPYEDMGVDFWWIDWQQGEDSKIANLDPLWLLNHYYYEDQCKRGKRPMIFSRYAGVGSHRYPIGFSGDTYATWRTLDFQPYFTLTAANIGYGWWSHDICGHMHGEKNNDCMIRWLQFGVFSPIMRLHSSGNPFFVKEPWNIPMEYRKIMGEFMRLRHRLIPYTYTMNYRAYAYDEPMIKPMYYENPNEKDAYEVNNEYYFGTELLVAPITSETHSIVRMAAADCYLPEGRYYDFFTGRIYEGGQRRKLYRDRSTIPVLLKAGGILPLDKQKEVENGAKNPSAFDIYIGAGANGAFELYEDDGITNEYVNGVCVKTTIGVSFNGEKKTLHISIKPAEGDLTLIPAKREYSIHILGIGEHEMGCYNRRKHELVLELGEHLVTEEVSITLENVELAKNCISEEVFDLLEAAWMGYDEKERIYYKLKDITDKDIYRKTIRTLNCDETLKDALEEIAAC